MDREQIIKALECCLVENDCTGCPLHHQYETDCLPYAGKKALSLIKELTEELAEKVIILVEFDKQIERLTEENERLSADVAKEFTCVFGTPHKVSDCPITDEIAKAKADTVSEIKTRFAMRFGTYTDKDMTPITEVFRLLDQIAKEMLEKG